jgi:ribosomal protein S12 methylthiotransferase
MPDTATQPSVQMVNLGCAKNVVDSEEMLGVLERNGYAIDSRRDADVVVINTCGFIEAAKQESIDAILEALERKKRGDVRKVVVAGCLSQRYGRDLAAEMPEVDAFIGAGQMQSIAQVVGDTLVRPGQLLEVPEKPHHRWVDVPTRVRSTAPWTAYLKISEGCDHTCTFCAIPSFRGKHVSKPLERIIEEARLLAGQGVKELNLIAQDSTQYGYDLYRKAMLPALLRELSQVDGVRWLRLFYCYPSRVNAAVIEAIATTPKVCQYIDMPLQHADDDVLRAMRRPMNADAYLRILSQFRAASPDVAIRTTFIVGFPGETEAQFENLMRFVEAAQFDRVGVFEYSTEDGTPSADLPGRVPSRVKRARKDKLMRLQQQISLARNQAWVGREIEVLVEETGRRGDGERTSMSPTLPLSHSPTLAVGRSFRDAPEVDGQVYVSGCNAQPGEFISARVTAARAYDLIAE